MSLKPLLPLPSPLTPLASEFGLSVVVFGSISVSICLQLPDLLAQSLSSRRLACPGTVPHGINLAWL